MGISFRKRIGMGKAGRINVSKGGVGGSIGSKAGRFGVSSAGTQYVRGGSNGVYFRSEATHSSKPTSSSPTSKSTPSQSPSDFPVITATMPMYEVTAEANGMMRDIMTQLNPITFRATTASVIEKYKHRYLVAVVNHETRGTFTESERAWKALANILMMNRFGDEFEIVAVRYQKLFSFIDTPNLEPYRTDFESLASDEAKLLQALRSWCAEFDDKWDRLVELGWLPRLGQP